MKKILSFFGLYVVCDSIFVGSEMLGCPIGIYKIKWRSGGSSIASIGILNNGERWIAPTNWTGKNNPTSTMLKQMIGIKSIQFLRN